MKRNIEMKYFRGEALIKFGRFRADGSWAIQLIDSQTGECIASPSACMIDYAGVRRPTMEQTWIKGYSENEGAKEALIKAGVIKEEIVQTFLNMHDAPFYLCTLTPEAIQIANAREG